MVEMITDFDTIAAIATAPGEGAIAIVRLSGEESINEVNSLFKGKDLTKVASHTLNYGHIYDPSNGEEIDEAMVTVLRAPKTFTREDIVEINCHGGVLATNRILQLVLSHGARLAEPGEFTKRAFLNGRIDLSQAEAVNDIIRAKTDKSIEVALNQLNGSLATKIRDLREQIVDVLAQVEVNIDYPEYDDFEKVTRKLLLTESNKIKQKIEDILSTAKQGKILREGLTTAIVGRPNVGKSSILNSLIQEDKAIVTNIAGTTRDVVEEYINIAGIPIKLVDTAGIRDTDNEIEQLGVEKSRKALQKADLVLLVLNSSEEMTSEDKELLELTNKTNRIIILNKSDLPNKLDKNSIKSNNNDIICTSAKTKEGIETIKQKITDIVFGGVQSSQQNILVTNARHISLLNRAKQSLNDVIDGIEKEMPVDLIQIDMKRAWDLLGEITGDTVQDELLNELFSRFCLGK